MIRRKHRPPKSEPKEWIVQNHYKGHAPGDEFTFEESAVFTSEGNQLRRRAKFKRHVVNPRVDPPAEWIDCFELVGGHYRTTRSIHPEQVLRWWKKKKSTPSHKAKKKARRNA